MNTATITHEGLRAAWQELWNIPDECHAFCDDRGCRHTAEGASVFEVRCAECGFAWLERRRGDVTGITAPGCPRCAVPARVVARFRP